MEDLPAGFRSPQGIDRTGQLTGERLDAAAAHHFPAAVAALVTDMPRTNQPAAFAADELFGLARGDIRPNHHGIPWAKRAAWMSCELTTWMRFEATLFEPDQALAEAPADFRKALPEEQDADHQHHEPVHHGELAKKGEERRHKLIHNTVIKS